MAEICVVGSLNMDLVAQVERVPEAGETITGTGFDTFPGGKGANQAVAAARLGMKVRMAGCVGADSFGKQLIHNMKKNKVDVRSVSKLRGVSTGIASVTLSGHENRIVLAGGANSCFTVKMAMRHQHEWRHSDLILLQNEIPFEVNEYIMKSFGGGIKILYNAAPAMQIKRELYPYIDLLIVNEHECEVLLDKRIKELGTAEEAARQLTKWGCKGVVITLGSHGAVFCDNGQTGRVDGLRVSAVDTTGAGDTFCGGLASAIGGGKSIAEAVVFANCAAALSVLKKGAQTSMPSGREVMEFMAGHRADII